MYYLDASSATPDRIRLQAPQACLDDLRERLLRTRWPDEVANADWAYGTNSTYLRALMQAWAEDFDWRAQEDWLNSFPQFRSQVGELTLHYVHLRSARQDAIPLLLLHGWPGSFLQMLKLLPLLTDPAAHGQPQAPAFHVVVASLPGFGYSDAFTRPGGNMEAIAALMHELMTAVLGYSRYGVRGSDIGGTVIDQLCRHYPAALIGAHLSQLIVPLTGTAPADATQAEQDFLARCATLATTELAYARQHATKPQTLAHALTDSPTGLASWIVEKYRSWGDTDGELERRFSREFLLATLTLYWLNSSISPAIRSYYEMVQQRGNMAYITVPTGFLMSRRDMFPAAPREWAARGYNVVHFCEAERGGHFLEWEEPELVARELRLFFNQLS